MVRRVVVTPHQVRPVHSPQRGARKGTVRRRVLRRMRTIRAGERKARVIRLEGLEISESSRIQTLLVVRKCRHHLHLLRRKRHRRAWRIHRSLRLPKRERVIPQQHQQEQEQAGAVEQQEQEAAAAVVGTAVTVCSRVHLTLHQHLNRPPHLPHNHHRHHRHLCLLRHLATITTMQTPILSQHLRRSVSHRSTWNSACQECRCLWAASMAAAHTTVL